MKKNLDDLNISSDGNIINRGNISNSFNANKLDEIIKELKAEYLEEEKEMGKRINIILRVSTNDGVSTRVTDNIDVLIRKYPNAEINVEITQDKERE